MRIKRTGVSAAVVYKTGFDMATLRPNALEAPDILVDMPPGRVGALIVVLVVHAKNLLVIKVVPLKAGEVFVQLDRVALPRNNWNKSQEESPRYSH